MLTTDDLRNSLGLPAGQFNEERAREAIDEVSALAVVYAGGQSAVDALEQSDDADDQARHEALRQVVKRWAKRVYDNPEGRLQQSIQNTGSVSYADSSESAHGLTRSLRRAVRSAVGGRRADSPHYASEAD